MGRSESRMYMSSDGRFSMVIGHGLLNSIHRLCHESAPLETGGIIIGSYNEDGSTAWVTRIEGPPPDSKRERNRFYRGSRGLQRLLESLWQQGEHYLGEWHFHPAGHPKPSPHDIMQMKAIAEEREARCPQPILIVAGADGTTATYVFPIDEAIVQLLPDHSNPR